MSIYYRVYGSTFDTYGTTTGSATYALARSGTPTTSGNATATTGPVGQVFTSPTYACRQVFLRFDTSATAAGTATIGVNCATVATVTGDFIEASEVPSSSNKIAGDSLSSLTMLGSVAMPMATGRYSIPLSGTPTITSDLRYLLSARKERLNTAPTGTDSAYITLADFAGTTSDPYLDIAAGTAWDYVGTGTSVQATATSHILTEPAGVAAGDLLVACIGSRIASTTSITLPGGWTLVSEQKTNNILSTSSAVPSAMMAYIVRGASPPALTFTHPVAPSVALGRVFAYRNVDQTTPLDASTGATSVTGALTAATGSALATTQDDDLLVMLAAGGQEGTWSGFGATGTGTSGTTADSVLDPQANEPLERSDILTTTGVDMSLAVADVVKSATAGSVFASATTTVAAANVMIVGAFKLVPTTPAGDTWNETVAETAAAAETLAVLEESKVRETGAADWRETESGAIRITEGLFVSPPIEESVAESASAADTVSAALAYTCAVAENAGANETVGNTALRIGALAESAAAADTSTGLLIRIGIVAETASAVETTDASIVPAAGIFDVMVVETAPVVDSTGTSAIFTRAITETTSAAETIGKALTLTAAVAETTTAAETIGGLALRSGAVAETAAAAETATGLLAVNAAIAETASASETITYNVAGSYNEAQVETAAAAETLTVQLAALGAVAEAASAFETTTRTVSYTRIVAETAAAADTVGGLRVIGGNIAESTSVGRLTEAGDWRETEAGVPRGTASTIDTVGGVLTGAAAVVETAAAAETITYSLTGAAGTTWNEVQAELAAAAETVAGLMVRVGAIAEAASAAETIGKTLACMSAVEETIGAATVAGQLASYTPGSDRNDFDGAVGVRLGIGGAAIPITHLGVRTHAGATGTRTLQLYEWFSSTIQRSVVVDLSGHATDEYVWGEIAPITLTAGGYYALLMEVSAGGPVWSNPGPAAFDGIVNVYDSYRVGAVGGALATGTAGNMFVGLDLGAGTVGGAVDTISSLLVKAGAIAETAAASETPGGLLVTATVMAETASAAETISATVIPAAGAFNETVAESASAADTVGGVLAWVAAIAETAAAAEAIDATVIRGALVIDVTVAESASAADTLTADIRRWIRESSPPWANWVEEATAAADWTKTAASGQWTREDAETGDWLLETRPVNRWTKE